MNYRRISIIQNCALAIFTLLMIAIHSESYGQIKLEGNTYSYITSETCKMKTDGGCWIVGYQVIEFEDDSVMIYDRVRGNCSPIDSMYDKDYLNLKTYYWRQIVDMIEIVGFNDFEVSITKGNKLIGKVNDENQRFELLIDQ